MTVSEKIKTIDNKREQNKFQCNLDRKAAKVSDFSSVNVNKYEFLTDKNVLSEKELLKNVATVKKFEYFPFDNKEDSDNR